MSRPRFDCGVAGVDRGQGRHAGRGLPSARRSAAAWRCAAATSTSLNVVLALAPKPVNSQPRARGFCCARRLNTEDVCIVRSEQTISPPVGVALLAASIWMRLWRPARTCWAAKLKPAADAAEDDLPEDRLGTFVATVRKHEAASLLRLLQARRRAGSIVTPDPAVRLVLRLIMSTLTACWRRAEIITVIAPPKRRAWRAIRSITCASVA